MLVFNTYQFITRGINIRRHYQNNKLKKAAPTWNDALKLPDIQDYFEYIIKKHETLTRIRINNILVFKIKDGYKLEL